MSLIFYIFFIFATLSYIFECQDTIPYQVSSNVYQIEETQAIIYKSFTKNKWRYSLYDQNGAIQATYVIEGLQDLAKSYYFIEQNNHLYLYTDNQPNYQLIDLNLLTNNGSGYLTSGVIQNANNPCSSGGMIRKYGTYYFLICSTPLFYLQEVSLSALQQTTQKYPYTVYTLSQSYLMFDSSLLVYKNNLFTNLSNVSSAGYILVDMNLIFGRDQNVGRFNVYNAMTLDLINRVGSSITNQAVQLEFIQYGYNLYTAKNCQYTALYNPNTNNVQISQAFSNLPDNYMLVNPPFYNFNFQQGSTIFLSQGSNRFLYNINQIYQMCSNTQYIQLDSTCGSSCPVTAFIDNSTKKCYCDKNTIILDKSSCTCQKNYYIQNTNQCKICTPYCQNCVSQNSCQSCQSGFNLQADGTCKCNDGTYLNNDICQPCDTSCATCNNSSKTSCLTCPSNNYLNPDNSCDSCNKNGYFIQGNNCVKCDPSCLTCNGIQRNNCLTCPSGQYLFQDGTCNLCNITNGFYISGGKCLSCDPSCQSCSNSSQTDCLTCRMNTYLHQDNSCKTCLVNSGYFISGFKCLPCDTTCQTCSGPYKNNCISCPQGNYLHQDNTCGNCDIQTGYSIKANLCLKCDSSCQTCSGTLSTNCLTCISGKYLFSNNSCNLCDTSNSYFIQGANCLACNPVCKTCSGSSKNQCLSCFEGFSLFSNTCQEQYLHYNSDIFTQSRINQAKDQIQSSSEASLAGTTILSSIQNIISQSSFGILTNSLICQKLSFLILIDVPIPAQIYQPLTAMKDQFPTNQFKMLNYFEPLLSKDQNQYQNARYEIVGISFNILQTCGQSTIIFGICIFIFGTFYILIKYIKSGRVLSIVVLIYQKLFSGFLIQFFQLISTMFVIGVNQQLKQFFFDINGSLPIGLQINLVTIYVFLIIVIFYQQIKFLNKTKKSNNQYDFVQLNKEKILNGAVYNDKIRRNFMIIYLFFESFLIPTLYIQFSFTWKITSTVCIALQFFELSIITLYMPFESKLSNGYFIVNNFLWLGLYIQYLIINIICKKPDINNYSKELDILSYSALITIQIVILQQSAYIIIALLVELYEYIKLKRQKKQNSFTINKSNNNIDSSFTQHNDISSLKINKNLMQQKLKLSYYEREMVQQKQFNSLVSNQVWVRIQPRNKDTKNNIL